MQCDVTTQTKAMAFFDYADAWTLPFNWTSQSRLTSVTGPAISLLQQTILHFTSRPSTPFPRPVSNLNPLTITPSYCHHLHNISEFWYVPMDADITQYTDVYTRHLTVMSHVPPLPAGASHNDSDGVVTTLFVRRYSTAYNLEVQSAADSTCQTNEESNLQWISLCPLRRKI